ncbi:SDR family NAD(P)-dependent oxidoreductase [Micromonospora sp. WMMD987]|jgi:NAD(P)-dependent dehydrogenase (short-subunit alcohol dehydrogenase family)|uniref:SDR family NAD(P)-dependent oxidoreductase n=1 Tax=Micromonospora TaxID=1873 RepID=UPI00249A8586|nr:SDR family NAD(P)-dependent oxidoreductase [Micromonospora sp. WMMD987]WFE97829.1 SDR family NAD(P)-dependent oxidoreductase [Micromonospora sp. WMMD987]
MDTQGRRAVVVGNSDGVGLALTRQLVAAGWTVTGVSRSGSDLTAPGYTHHVADVTGDTYRTVLAGAVDRLGGLDVCVYAAGVGEFFDLGDLAAQTRALEVNLIGAARTVEVVVPAMVAGGGGHLVGLSSLADAAPSAQAPGYAAAKAGLTSYLVGLRGALRPHGVRVTVVRFGFVDTKMAKSPVTPMLLSVERAADVVRDCLRTRPAVVSRPRRMAAVVRAAGVATRVAARR